MAILIDINATDIIRYIQNLEKAPKEIQKGASYAINRVGDNVVSEIVEEISAETGVSQAAIRRALVITRSRPETMMYRIDAKAALIEAPATRPMRNKRTFAKKSDNYFQKDEMVEVVTMDDEKVCPICEKIQKQGPYKVGEARTLIPAHPNCRCLLQPVRKKKERSLSFRKRSAARTSEQTQERIKRDLRKEVIKAMEKVARATRLKVRAR